MVSCLGEWDWMKKFSHFALLKNFKMVHSRPTSPCLFPLARMTRKVVVRMLIISRNLLFLGASGHFKDMRYLLLCAWYVGTMCPKWPCFPSCWKCHVLLVINYLDVSASTRVWEQCQQVGPCVHHGMVSSATDILHPMLFATQGLKKQLKFSPPSLPLLGLCPDDKLHADFLHLTVAVVRNWWSLLQSSWRKTFLPQCNFHFYLSDKCTDRQ